MAVTAHCSQEIEIMTAICSQQATGEHMETTIELLEQALKQHPAPYWTQRLNLARTTLATAKVR